VTVRCPGTPPRRHPRTSRTGIDQVHAVARVTGSMYPGLRSSETTAWWRGCRAAGGWSLADHGLRGGLRSACQGTGVGVPKGASRRSAAANHAIAPLVRPAATDFSVIESMCPARRGVPRSDIVINVRRSLREVPTAPLDLNTDEGRRNSSKHPEAVDRFSRP